MHTTLGPINVIADLHGIFVGLSLTIPFSDMYRGIGYTGVHILYIMIRCEGGGGLLKMDIL